MDIDYILVYKLSRFGRNAADILNSLELVQSYGVNLICIEEGIDSSQTSGKLLISVLTAVAEIERENIIEQTMNGRREKARQGGWNGGFAPYGYTLEDNKLMIEETEAVAIRKIFELYTSSEIGLGGIANQLNLQGIRKIPRQMLKKTDIEPMVIEAIREIVRNEEYAQAIKKRIGVQIDTKAVDKELEGYQAKLKEVDLNKTRLEREIDSLPADAKYRERKLHDMTLRLDSLYDVIVELEEKIEDARLRRDAIKQQAITLENIYKIMVNFDCVYNIINDEEKRNVVTALIKEIEIYRNDESEFSGVQGWRGSYGAFVGQREYR